MVPPFVLLYQKCRQIFFPYFFLNASMEGNLKWITALTKFRIDSIYGRWSSKKFFFRQKNIWKSRKKRCLAFWNKYTISVDYYINALSTTLKRNICYAHLYTHGTVFKICPFSHAFSIKMSSYTKLACH